MSKSPAPVAAHEVPPQARGGCYVMDPRTGKVTAASESERAPPASPEPEAST